ncbi:EpsD family peptidyl-prolyl cis-trans isomerase [Methylocaldum sp.]|uniref:EpsD family peptidyl-prolyl cis-trans isomerase n=1 Tax=Methylocaldum sp. TaxID=1969727 RepID=UPI002D535033|nr:EpsD family peptidyl-prolyl cis-trans isomerase [Methylocaldum sp.]HYE35013.1 EpsD family peptidyl-prolyl cis-trans isomerase [Methylocaldum sp.]
MLSGCDSQSASEKATQIAARVNGEEISVGQIDVLVARSGADTDGQAKSTQEKSIDNLIDQQLLSQQAIEKHLDRDPQVTLAMAMAKRQVLAQAYLDHVGQAVSKPEPGEISAFYKFHPQLFEKRKIYKFDEISIPLTPKNRDAIEPHVKQPVRFDALSKWLQEQNIPHTSETVVRAAEQLPLERLEEFDHLKKGEAASFTEDEKLVVLQLSAIKEAPLDYDKAAPLIEVFLMNRNRKVLIDRELSRLRQAATVEYFGDFEKPETPRQR